MAHAQLPYSIARRDSRCGATHGGCSPWWWDVLLSFVVYATWAAFQNGHYRFGPISSPFYSPEILGDSPHAWFGPKPAVWPGWSRFRPRC